MDVGERLQSIRKLKGLSQRELAKRAGVTNSTISMIEKNSVSPSISSLRKVLGGLKKQLVAQFSTRLADPVFAKDAETMLVANPDWRAAVQQAVKAKRSLNTISNSLF